MSAGNYVQSLKAKVVPTCQLLFWLHSTSGSLAQLSDPFSRLSLLFLTQATFVCLLGVPQQLPHWVAASVLTARPQIYVPHSSPGDSFEVQDSSWCISAQDVSLSLPALAKCQFSGTLSSLHPYPLCCTWLPAVSQTYHASSDLRPLHLLFPLPRMFSL